jgi:putative tricarboxylic transport membrane protein
MASFTMAIMGLLTARVFIRILKISPTIFLPVVLVLTTIGSFSVGGGINDLYLMLGVGFVAWAMIEMKYPIAPLVIGVILGGLFDESLRRALLVSDGDLLVFLSRPVSAILLAASVLLVLSQVPGARRLLGRRRELGRSDAGERNV